MFVWQSTCDAIEKKLIEQRDKAYKDYEVLQAEHEHALRANTRAAELIENMKNELAVLKNEHRPHVDLLDPLDKTGHLVMWSSFYLHGSLGSSASRLFAIGLGQVGQGKTKPADISDTNLREAGVLGPAVYTDMLIEIDCANVELRQQIAAQAVLRIAHLQYVVDIAPLGGCQEVNPGVYGYRGLNLDIRRRTDIGLIMLCFGADAPYLEEPVRIRITLRGMPHKEEAHDDPRQLDLPFSDELRDV